MVILKDKSVSSDKTKTSYSTYLAVIKSSKSYEGKINPVLIKSLLGSQLWGKLKKMEIGCQKPNIMQNLIGPTGKNSEIYFYTFFLCGFGAKTFFRVLTT